MAAKGYDESPPRNGTIVFYTILTLSFLVVVKYSLDSYFAKVMTGEVHDKVLSRGMEPMKAMRAKEQKMLQSAATPIDRAMQMISQRGRSASPMITPKSGMGDDGYGMEEVKGWTKLDRKVLPIARPEAAAVTDGTAPAPGVAGTPAAPAPSPTAVAPTGR